MKARLLILFIGLFGIPNLALGQDALLIRRDSISSSEQKIVSEQVDQIKKCCSSISTKERYPFAYIDWFRCKDIQLFLKRVIMNDDKIEQICLQDSILTITYHPDFYVFNSMDAVYYMYNDMYKTYFSYDEILAIGITLTDKTNLTFLPTINPDFWSPIKGGLIKKEWFIPDIDYVVLLGAGLIESGEYSSPDNYFEYDPDKIEKKIRDYRCLIEDGNDKFSIGQIIYFDKKQYTGVWFQTESLKSRKS